MGILRDKDLYGEISRGRIIVDGLPDGDLSYDRLHSPIQACSLDLAIGDIFHPGASTDPNDDRSASDEPCISETSYGVGLHEPVDEYILRPGETAHIRTREVLDVPANMAGIAFPPSDLAMNGILTTNPGHVDPGYHGRLHLTIINMGRSCQPLHRGQRIITVLFFAMADVSQFPYSVRVQKAHQQGKPAGQDVPVNEGDTGGQGVDERAHIEKTIRKLAPDFMNFRRHATDIADQVATEKVKAIKGKVDRLQFYEKVVAIVAGIVLSAFGVFGQCRYSGIEERINSLDKQMDVVGRLAAIEGDVGRMKEPLPYPGIGDNKGIAPSPVQAPPLEELK